MPNYNYERYIEKRLNSIINNLKEKIEIEKNRLNLDDTSIYIFKTIHPGVSLRVGTEHIRVYDEMEGRLVKLQNNNVVFLPIN